MSEKQKVDLTVQELCVRDRNGVPEMVQKSGRLCRKSQAETLNTATGLRGGLAYSRGLEGGSSEIFKMPPSLFFYLVVLCGLFSKGSPSVLSRTPYEVKF